MLAARAASEGAAADAPEPLPALGRLVPFSAPLACNLERFCTAELPVALGLAATPFAGTAAASANLDDLPTEAFDFAKVDLSVRPLSDDFWLCEPAFPDLSPDLAPEPEPEPDEPEVPDLEVLGLEELELEELELEELDLALEELELGELELAAEELDPELEPVAEEEEPLDALPLAEPPDAVPPVELPEADAAPVEDDVALPWLALDEDEAPPEASDAEDADADVAAGLVAPDEVAAEEVVAEEAPEPAAAAGAGAEEGAVIDAEPRGGAATAGVTTGATTGAARIVLFVLGTSVSK